ncbi:MAG: ChbG/HpnK family deacetylase [Bacteroidota bacterium]|nr:ChbG/HpnK family deacetylase [Bacteroidota bacterium]
MSARKLIVNADDFGQSEGINKGIIQAYEQGILTSASLMVQYSAATEAVAYAKNNQSLGIGLHVDLGEWKYINGDWAPLYEIVSLNDRDEVEKEVKCQLETFFLIMGRKPTHIDSHQHIHLRENICPVFIKIAQSLDVTLRRCSKVIRYCGDFYGQCADGSPFHQAISVEGLQKIIMKLPEGYTEMACHPALEDDIDTMYRTERKKEVMTLCDKSIKEFVDKADVELCSFENIPFTDKSAVIY